MVDNADELVAELQRERQKNAVLLQRISTLEAQIMQFQKDKDSSVAPIMENNNNNCQDSHHNTTEETRSKKHKVQKTRSSAEKSTMKLDDDDTQSPKNSKLENDLLSWMSMDAVPQLPQLFDKSKDVESMLECDDEDDEPSTYEDIESCVKIKDEDNDRGSIGKNMHHINSHDKQNEIDQFQSMNRKPEQDWEEVKKSKGFRNLSLQKKSPKLAFCPKEVRGILESSFLDMKNSQSHTMRKIIVFASLGIRHGCDDMYELDYNHFTILRKGDPYVSRTNPGHVLYENPGGMRKVFYPNRGNSALCPVRILQEEHAMHPLDGTCPSCLFLCIKYGGKTRNIPQNEYVRQRMGRNKLKSFGPLICVMARLVNIRTGSFFFKALGITLLFMAGFSGDIVQSETNRKLDLFQKYYRTDEDAAGEELFLVNLSTSELPYISPDTLKHNSKMKKSRRKKQPAKSTNNNKNSKNTPQGTIAPDTTFQIVSSSNNVILQPHIVYNQHPLYPLPFPIYWPPVQNAAYPTWPHHPCTIGLQSLKGMNGGHLVHPCLPHYSQGLGSRVAVNSDNVVNAVTNSASSSCSTKPK